MMEPAPVKTTIELDETKLEKVMKLGGFSTRKDAVDWALGEAVRIVTLNHIKNTPWTPALLKDAVVKGYDALATRQETRKQAAKGTAARGRKK